MEDCRISVKSIAEQLGISHEQVGSIIHEDLDMQNFSAKWVPKCLNADQKRQRCQSSEQVLEFFSARSKRFPVEIGNHGRSLVISLRPGDKATKWRHSGSPRPQKFRWKSSCLEFGGWGRGIKTASSSLIIFQRAKLSTQSITHLCWCN